MPSLPSSSITSFEPPRRILMGPGPSPVPDRVLQALARPTIGHQDPRFVAMMDEVKALLQATFRTANETTFAVSAPGSAGMEAAMVNLVEPGDTVVIGRNGAFGERMRENVARAGGLAVVVDVPWGEALPPEGLAEALRAHPEAKAVAFVHAETSTGVVNDAAALARVGQEAGCLVIMDCVTSLGGMPVEVDAWGVDVAYAGTQKCLAAPPGISPITFSDRAVERTRERETPVQSWFLDVSLLTGYWSAGEGGGAKRTYHHTAPVNALYGLHEALVMLHEEGLEAAWERHARHHAALRDGLEALGLAFLVRPEQRLPMLSTVRIPPGADDARVRGHLLEKHGLEIGAGLGPLAGQIWRIGLMGAGASEQHVRTCVETLGATLAEEGAAVDLDAARQALAAAYGG